MTSEIICRACLNTYGTMHNLFGADAIQLEQGKVSVAEFMGLLMKLVVEEEEGLPDKICQSCYFEIQRAYQFKTKCDRSQAVLTQLQNVKIKMKKLKSDISNDTTKKKSMLMNGINPSKKLMNIPNKIETTTKMSTENYVEIIEDPMNLIEFEHFAGTPLNAMDDLDLIGVIIKEEELSDAASIFEGDNFADTANNAMEDVPRNQMFEAGNLMKNDMEEKNFECPVCPYVHVSVDGMEKHMVKNHLIENTCTICNKEIIGDQKQHLAMHIGPHMDYDEMIEGVTLFGSELQCSSCPSLFQEQSDLNAHTVKLHSLPNQVADNLQNKNVSSSLGNGAIKVDDLFNEIIEETLEDDPYQCSVCSDVFDEDDTLTDADKIHDTKNVFNCDFCVNTFLNQDDLIEHVKNMHPVTNINGQTVFKCNSCPDVFLQKSMLIDHMKCHDSDRPFKCDYCSQTFRFKHNLDCHLRFKHCPECKGVKNVDCKTCSTRRDTKIGIECDVCHKLLSNKSSLIRHRRTHRDAKPFKCELCSQSFNYKQILHLHVKEKHGDTKPAVETELQCKTCTRVFGRKVDLIQHMKSHEVNKLYQCPYCPKSFDYNAMLVRHLNNHTGEGGFKCVLCSEKFDSELNFKTHIAEKHADIGEDTACYKCEECGKMFAVKSHYDEHVQAHNKEKPYECDVCKQTFRYMHSLNRHVSTYHTKVASNHQCQLCPESFQDRNELVKHFRTHTGEKSFGCDMCSEKFPDKLRLGAHIVLKHETKNVQNQQYTCEECSKVFGQKSQYDAHVKTHVGETLFYCDQCSQSFRFRPALIQHIERFHQNNGTPQLEEQNVIMIDKPAADTMAMLVNENNIMYGSGENENSFAFGDSFLNDDQIMNIQAPDSIISELFEESSIEVA